MDAPLDDKYMYLTLTVQYRSHTKGKFALKNIESCRRRPTSKIHDDMILRSEVPDQRSRPDSDVVAVNVYDLATVSIETKTSGPKLQLCLNHISRTIFSMY